MTKEIEKMKTAELRNLAETQKIEGFEEMEREDLIKALKGEKEEKGEEKEKEEDLNDLTVPQLKALAKEKGIDLKKAKTKQPIIKAIQKGEKKVEKKPEEEKDKGAKVIGLGIKEEHVPVGSKAEMMKKRLARQPKVRIIIPLEPKEKIGSTEPVILNGYRLNIMKGMYVDVPEQVAEVIMDSQKQTRIAMAHALQLTGEEKELG